MSLMSAMTNANPKTYNVALVVILLAFIAMAVGAGAMLQKAGRLPAPPLTATNCIDEKFKFLHEADLTDVNLISVGSSATWRNLDMSVIEETLPGAKPMNVAPCFLDMKQTAYLADFMLDNMPDVKTVLSVVHLRDFTTCPAVDTEFFDPKQARGYIFDKKTPWLLYFKNFSLTPFLLDVKHLKDMRTDPYNMNSMVMDEYGTGFLRVLNPWRPDAKLNDACFEGVAQLEQSAKEHGARAVIVILPTMPSYKSEFDPDGDVHAQLRAKIRAQLSEPGSIVIDAEDLGWTDERFADPVHLLSENTAPFTERVARGLSAHALN